ncbi:hypothetical protein [Brachybacterium sacelli]|uniref:Permease n=1 Tax=Brachybacterium sacelli TaxID=173364 RepID=A0ABS4X6G0_9MICO|nr:hypothetical protein [Brachybacterium sacelli]MBP2383304.1 hypothetical protein [Brachybacterium sacelli]
MFWKSYGLVIGWLFVVGIVTAGVFLFVVFTRLVPLDRGEESALVLMPFYGAFFGALTAAAASALYAICMILWTRERNRSITSRAWLGALSAGTGALVFWIVFGFSLSGISGLPVWSGIGAGSAALAMLTAGSFTSRASRRADAKQTGSA